MLLLCLCHVYTVSVVDVHIKHGHGSGYRTAHGQDRRSAAQPHRINLHERNNPELDECKKAAREPACGVTTVCVVNLDSVAGRAVSAGSDPPSWISVAKQKQKIYKENSLEEITVKKVDLQRSTKTGCTRAEYATTT